MGDSGFWGWVTSGWSDWKDPVASVTRDAKELWAGFTGAPDPHLTNQGYGAVNTAIADTGAVIFGNGELAASAAGSNGTDGSSDSDGLANSDDDGSFFSGWQPWAIGLGILALLFLIVALLHEVREI